MSVISPRVGGAFAAPRGVRKVKNAVAAVLVGASFLVALVPLIWLLWTVLSSGISQLMHASWWTETQRNVSPSAAGGGVLHAIVGTLELIVITSAISVPIGLLVGVYLVEYGRGVFAKITTFTVDILTGIPSIVAALFVFALFITTLGGQKSGFLAALALVILMVPVIVRSTEEMLKLVPNELREASFALGIPKWRTILKVVIPTALSGLITGVVLGIARVAGETAPLLILVGYNASMNWNPFSGFQSSLPLEIKQQFQNINTSTGGISYHLNAEGQRVAGAAANFAPDRMWGTALTLILIVLLLNVIARLIGRRGKVSR
jgi:phosphate transport system permease protein